MGSVLRIYYSSRSPLAEDAARNLAVRVGASITKFDFQTQSQMPEVAVIRFSDERNHALARVIAADLEYSWRIEKVAGPGGLGRDTIEVWLPSK
jgi:hypothetical protein